MGEKPLNFTIVLSYLPFFWKYASTHFRMIVTKNYLLELPFHIRTNRSLFQPTLKITFFFEDFPCFLSKILPLQTLFFHKILIYNFCPSCDISLKSSWGLDFKYIYFYGSKRFYFSYNESYHICFFAKKVCKLTFRWILQKIVFEFTFFYIHQWIPY